MSLKVKENGRTQETCTKALIPVRDALDILSGKWKLPIIIALSFGNRRFSELGKQVHGITDKMLSKELRELEINARHVHFNDTRINLITYGNFFLLIVIIYKCKLLSIGSKENTTLEVVDVKVF